MAKRNPKTMTDRQLLDRGHRIVDQFQEYSRSDPFGWDWPTMGMVFPELVAEFRELRAEYNGRPRDEK